jgi:hypothetical protein
VSDDYCDLSTDSGHSSAHGLNGPRRRQPASSVSAGAGQDAEALARRFHETYERLAPEHGYETRKASAVPWEDVPEPNRALMVAVASELLSAGRAGSGGGLVVGYLRPTAIIVGASYTSDLTSGTHWIVVARDAALAAFGRYDLAQLVSPIIDGVVNNERSFYIAWDGSKEGWDESDRGDEARAEFVAWLRAQAYEDGSSPLDWVELQYGGDDGEVVALAHRAAE